MVEQIRSFAQINVVQPITMRTIEIRLTFCLYETKSGKTYCFCYDQGYIEIGEGKYAIVRRKAYVEQD